MSAVRGSGENATFYTYSYRTMSESGYGGANSVKVVSEEIPIMHPLTKMQAETMCTKFNFLAKQTYEESTSKKTNIKKTKSKLNAKKQKVITSQQEQQR